ncbi:oligogalacturonide transport system substrate-binding protein [Natranaerovirga hydrolytica]|uniref:Oligogalacturonide transport system substrate-binding protein n=1 Tax=Natranaerovirga hydrolytica TaxID=680378 RepID=A0A4R1MJ56_9FIRM|nr:ABC transporter substrate-binding protein [Natranaerovirga hydrolytica]TCK92726.1 oligogalacturonide transport system substrate-binding protein [Natranaerovirga hydrolytica]
MKKIMILVLVFALTLSIVGCSNGGSQDLPEQGSTNGGSGNSKDDDKIELRFSWWGGDARHQATLEVIRLFEEANPNVTVIPEYTAWSGHFERISAQLTANDEADAMQINFNWFYNFSPDGDGFYDLQELDSIDLTNWPEESFDAVTINGKVQGVPTSLGSRIYYLNKTMYDEAGVDIPETWDDLMAAGRAFRDNLGPDYYPIGNVGYDEGVAMMTFGYLAQKYGKNIFEGDQMAYTAEELADGLRFVQELIDNNVIPTFHEDSQERNHENSNWVNGRYAGVYLWNSNINVYAENIDPSTNPEVIAAPFIKLNDEQLHSGVFDKVLMAFSVSKNSEHPEVAASLINFMYTNEDAIRAHGLERGIPLNQVAVEVLENDGLLEGLQYDGHLLIQDVERYTYHPYFEDNTVRITYGDIFTEFVMSEGTMDPEVAAARIIEDFNNAVEIAMEQ